MRTHAKDLEFTVSFLRKRFPNAIRTDEFLHVLAQAFLKGVTPKIDDQGQIYGIGLVPDPDFDVAPLLSAAETDPFAFDVLTSWVHGHMLHSGTVPDIRAARFVAGHHFKNRARPKGRSGRKSKDHLETQYYIISRAIEHLKERGYTVSRNDATNTMSACDIVAEAMTKLGFSPSGYDQIKRIYHEVKRRGFIS